MSTGCTPPSVLHRVYFTECTPPGVPPPSILHRVYSTELSTFPQPSSISALISGLGRLLPERISRTKVAERGRAFRKQEVEAEGAQRSARNTLSRFRPSERLQGNRIFVPKYRYKIQPPLKLVERGYADLFPTWNT